MESYQERQRILEKLVTGSPRRIRVMWHDLGEALRLKITPAQRELLMLISQGDGTCHISDIAHQMGVTNGAVSQLVDGLQHNKIVHRTTDKYDARRVCVEITPLGEAKLKEAVEYYVEKFDKILAPLSLQQLRAISKAHDLIIAYGDKTEQA